MQDKKQWKTPTITELDHKDSAGGAGGAEGAHNPGSTYHTGFSFTVVIGATGVLGS